MKENKITKLGIIKYFDPGHETTGLGLGLVLGLGTSGLGLGLGLDKVVLSTALLIYAETDKTIQQCQSTIVTTFDSDQYFRKSNS